MSEQIDKLAYQAVFGSDEDKQKARDEIYEKGKEIGAYPASIHDLYMARGRKEYLGFSVPAINVRAANYYTARAAIRAAKKLNVGAIIFEIARSEIGYTDQRPAEFASSITAAAIKEDFRGPLFLQGDHYQFSLKKFKVDPEAETEAIKDLIKESIEGRMYNIDIDASTLVDLDKETEREQQKNNYLKCAELTKYIRELEPEGVTVSTGGEIGHIGGKNSNPAEMRTFLDGFKENIGDDLAGLSKVSVQTGTSHGGVVLADGTLADVKIDFKTLEEMSGVCQEYGLGGAVQHGASTLPDEAFDNFPKRNTLEVHLATGFQNIMYDHEKFPQDLKNKMYKYIEEKHGDERKEDWTDEQFHYKLRKKALGPFKKDLWELPEDVQSAIMDSLEEKFSFMFKQLNVVDTKKVVDELYR